MKSRWYMFTVLLFQNYLTTSTMKTTIRIAAPWTLSRHTQKRAPWWDYHQNGQYGVTLCTHDLMPIFGTYENGVFECSDIGEAALWFWQELPEHASVEVTLQGLEMTPYSIHAILTLARPMEALSVSTREEVSKTTSKRSPLARIIGSFKAMVTRSARDLKWLDAQQPLWQTGYHDHIMMSEQEGAYYEALLLESTDGQVWSSQQLQEVEYPIWLEQLQDIWALRKAERARLAIAQTECNVGH